MECVLELDDESSLWVENTDEAGENENLRLYILDGEEIQEIDCEEMQIKADATAMWEYKDADGDEKKDILLTTKDAIWVFVQGESGQYVLWEEEPLKPIRKRV